MALSVMKLPLRVRLTLWYSAVVGLTLAVFGVLTYLTVSQSLHQNLDTSLARVATSLEYIIKNKQEATNKPLAPPQKHKSKKAPKQDQLAFLTEQFNAKRPAVVQRRRAGPPPPPTFNGDSTLSDTTEEEPDVVWSAVYEHILLNAKNFLIQIADTSKRAYWRSVNLDTNTLPVYTEFTITQENPEGKYYTNFVDSKGQSLRVFALHSPIAEITIAYPLTEIEATLSDLFGVLKIGLPFAILMAVLGGYFLARYSLRQVDIITHSAQQITAHNLSKRLPMPQADDEIARLTTTLNEMIARLEASFSQIKQFTGDASHELRTPLAILMGELELALRRTRSPEDYQVIISSALEEVIRLSKVVESLLELSRADTGQMRLNYELVNISKIAADICEDLELLAEEKNIKLQHEIQPFVTLMADAARLHQIILNVVDNAIKYTPEGGSVAVKIFVDNTETKMVISDTGVGIPPEDIAHIFDRFYRVDKSRSHDAQGSGLGLSIVKWIVEAHKGSISVQSTLGEGSTFTITLPADPFAKQGEESVA